jgi:hypothetical protein
LQVLVFEKICGSQAAFKVQELIFDLIQKSIQFIQFS